LRFVGTGTARGQQEHRQQQQGENAAPGEHGAYSSLFMILNSPLFEVTPSLRNAVAFCALMVLMLRLNFSAISVTVMPAR
jgi:hypothetical protein